MDIIAGALLLGGAILGAARGLYRSLAGVLALLLAFAGAAWLTETCAAGVEDTIRPTLAERLERIVHDAVEEKTAPAEDAATGSELFSSAEALLKRFGWEGDLSAVVEDRTESALRGAEAALAAALLESLLPSLVRTVLRVVFFLLLLVALRLLLWLLRPLFEHLPVVRQCNTLLGAAAGLAQGALLAWALLWFARKVGLLSAAGALPMAWSVSLFLR